MQGSIDHGRLKATKMEHPRVRSTSASLPRLAFNSAYSAYSATSHSPCICLDANSIVLVPKESRTVQIAPRRVRVHAHSVASFVLRGERLQVGRAGRYEPATAPSPRTGNSSRMHPASLARMRLTWSPCRRAPADGRFLRCLARPVAAAPRPSVGGA
jgi:hypothetical protein